MKNVLLFMGLFLNLSAYSQVVEKEGLLWKITGKDLKQPSYLFGTYHGTYAIGADFLDSIPGFYNAFNSISQYIGESDFSPETLKATNEYFTKYYGEQQMPTDTIYENLLDKNDYLYLDSIVHVLGKTSLNKIPIRPNYLWFLILQEKRNDFIQQVFNIPKRETMDLYLQKTAKSKGDTVKGLDSPDIVFKSLELLYGNAPLPQSLQESADTLINNTKKNDKTSKPEYFSLELVRNIKDFESAYKRQDLLELQNYKKEQIEMLKKIQNIKIDMDFLLEERSLSWAEKIPELISSQPTMIGVGVMHLCGKDGLINLLRQKGYQLERVK